MSFRGGVRGKGKPYQSVNFEAKEVPDGPEANEDGSKGENAPKHDDSCCGPIETELELDESGLLFFNELKNMWNMLKRSPPVVSRLLRRFDASPDACSDALRLAHNCQDFHSAKGKSLPAFVLEELKGWTAANRAKAARSLTARLKRDAFKLASRRASRAVAKLLVEAFELADVEEGVSVGAIRCMVARKMYKEACQFAGLLGLHDSFPIDEFVVPLVLQDRLFGVDEFLAGSPGHQAALVAFLDGVLGGASVRDSMAGYVERRRIPDVKHDKLHAKPWKKLIARLAKAFRLPAELTPNLNRRRNEGALNFLLYKRFVENSFGDESWKEMVEEAVNDDPALGAELVHQVALYGEPAEALRWAHFYRVDKAAWPYSVRMLDEEGEEGRRPRPPPSRPEDEAEWEPEPRRTVEFHELGLPAGAVKVVDSIGEFERFLDKGLEGVEVVGVDCEWKPSFGSQPNELALMQIATRREVFVFDIVQLGKKAESLWLEMGKFLFNNCEVLKLGFSFTGDIDMIKHALPGLSFSPKQVGFLDLCHLWKHLDRYPDVKYPYEVHRGGPSLCTLVHRCLGRPLDKSEQFSNWERRPLRPSQIAYAALDAYCLIEAYDVMRERCVAAGRAFDDVCYGLMTQQLQHQQLDGQRRKKKHKNARNRRKNAKPEKEVPQPAGPHAEPVPANEVKVVCDASLQGLGRKLRSCGVDSAILAADQDQKECAKCAQDEQRFILTKGYEAFRTLKGQVPSGHCLRIVSDDIEEQIKEVVDYYKIIVTKDHVFSRCQACNGHNFVKVSRSTMDALVGTSGARKVCPPPCYFEDEATGFSSEDDFEEACQPVSFTRKWELYPDEKVDVGLCKTRLGARIQVQNVPEPVVAQHDFFYVCEECGKVYWDGSHLGKALEGRLHDIVQ